MEALHSVPTTLLFSLEAIPGLQWDKLQRVRSRDGSYLFCPSSTAFAFNQSKDPHCLAYLNNVAQNFNGGGGMCITPINKKHKSLLITSPDNIVRMTY